MFRCKFLDDEYFPPELGFGPRRCTRNPLRNPFFYFAHLGSISISQMPFFQSVLFSSSTMRSYRNLVKIKLFCVLGAGSFRKLWSLRKMWFLFCFSLALDVCLLGRFLTFSSKNPIFFWGPLLSFYMKNWVPLSLFSIRNPLLCCRICWWDWILCIFWKKLLAME